MTDTDAEAIVSKNKNTIIITQKEDGNWKAWTHKNGKLLVARQISPGSALEYLMVQS